ncbi:efflux RND transporter permease subunit [Desulfatiferula olefinivorans]
MVDRIIRYFMENKLVAVLAALGFIGWGLITAPFDWRLGPLPSNPVPVDAIPDIGENQQIVFTEWPGRSPQDIDDQITYPLTTYLLGLPGVKSVRSSSVFGFSSIYIIFDEDVEFYWSRSRILEKINAIPPSLLPDGVQPTLGPDATALGQVFWYTIEGRDAQGRPSGGWDLHEIRSVQDYYVTYALNAVPGVSEVASIGGFVQEYRIDVNPDALSAHGVPLSLVVSAVRQSNRDVGAKTIEINQAEYLVRGLGYLRSVADIEKIVVSVSNNVPIRIRDVANVSLGPAVRRGVLDKDGAEVVGGVVVARYGANPLSTIDAVKDRIRDIAPGLPVKTLPDGTESRLTIVPFYDRSTLIYETLGTLEEALSLQILTTILVIIVMIRNLRASVMISALLPMAVLMVFIVMRYAGVDANIVALSGIAIAIGTMVDLGIILSENVIRSIREAPEGRPLMESVYQGASDVSSAIITAVSTTIVSFIPVFTLEAAEGKLFGPLAFTKTFALIAALMVSLFILPVMAQFFFGFRLKTRRSGIVFGSLLVMAGITAIVSGAAWGGVVLTAFGLSSVSEKIFPVPDAPFQRWYHRLTSKANMIITVAAVIWLLASYWLPLGPGRSLLVNMLFVALLVGLILAFFSILEYFYAPLLAVCLEYKKTFLAFPCALVLLGLTIWLGFPVLFGPLAKGTDYLGWNIRTTRVWSGLAHALPGMGKEFMPSLDEGSFLLMPTSMAHSGMEYNRTVLGRLDMAVTSIPEVDGTVGKLGRVESALDPAPVSMFENVIAYKPEYAVNERGHRIRFSTDGKGRFLTTDGEALTQDEALSMSIGPAQLIPDEDGLYFRNWRSHIRSPDDIWAEIVEAATIPGVTSAPKLQPIETRLVMLQTGMRAPMGIKVYGPDLSTIEAFGIELEAILKQVPAVKTEAVFADRVIGKPYLHLDLDREAMGRFGLSVEDVQQVIETAVGGMTLTRTVEGRERYSVRVRYPRELRDDPESLLRILVPTPDGARIPLGQVVSMTFHRGPQMIKSEDGFLVGYVLFDKQKGHAEVDVVNDARNAITARIGEGTLSVPPGVNFRFSGSYENQVRAEKRLTVIIPLVLAVVFLILYFQFRSVTTALMIFSGVALSFSGGFILLWLYGQGWFADVFLFGTHLRELFNMGAVNLSVAVWVGFIALFGLATDDGVVMGTYIDQSFRRHRPQTIDGVRAAVIDAGCRRIKPAVMTSATTVIALLPVLTSTGRGADIMGPMAIPQFGGMLVAAVTYFIVPTLYCLREERRIGKGRP